MAEKESDSLEPKKKKEGKTGKLLTGIIIGGAVGSVLGITLSDKDNRDFVKKKSRETWQKSQILLGEVMGKKKQKKGIWHMLHRLLVRKDEKDD